MLRIRPEQMRALGEAMQRNFESRMVAYLRGHFQAQLAHQSEEQLLAVVREGIANADLYGITIEKDVARFIEYAVMYGSDFHARRGWVATVLRTGGINGTQKMDRIDNQALFERKMP
jgi:hypothetical protein